MKFLKTNLLFFLGFWALPVFLPGFSQWIAQPILSGSGNIPNFQLRDQFGRQYRTADLQNKSVVLAGCYPEDEEICRKVGRKIYWKMQTFAFGKEDQFASLGYLLLNEQNKLVAEKLVLKYKTPGYEPVLLDWEGDLEKGMKKGRVFLRGFNAQGQLVFRDYKTQVDNEYVKKLYKKVMGE